MQESFLSVVKNSSKEATRDGRGSKPFDLNLRTILAFREIGKGHAGIKMFCGCMNMPPPMTELTYKHNKNNNAPNLSWSYPQKYGKCWYVCTQPNN